MPFLMKEYTNGGKNRQEQYFGLNICSARNIIECAFGRLKARFGALKRAMDINIEELPFVTYACFVLHNFCELNHETVIEKIKSEQQSTIYMIVISSQEQNPEGMQMREMSQQARK